MSQFILPHEVISLKQEFQISFFYDWISLERQQLDFMA